MYKDARLSVSGMHRYWLLRKWDETLPTVVFCMLNPSTADDKKDDPTVSKCITLSTNNGYGTVVIVNLYAIRSSNPAAIQAAGDAVGQDNDIVITSMCDHRDVVCAWGSRASDPARIRHVRDIIKTCASKTLMIGRNQDNSPSHPLYAQSSAQFIPFD